MTAASEKNTNFFYEMLAPLWHGQFEPLDIFLPVGISFFTFQSLSYTIDVYRRVIAISLSKSNDKK